MLGSSEHLILQSVGSSLYQWILIQKVALYISAHLAFVCWQAIIYYYYWTHYLFGNLFLITGTPLIQKYRQACTSGPIVACLSAIWYAELISGFSARRIVNIVAGNSVRGDDDLMDDDLTFRTIDPCHPGTCPGIPLRWSKIFWFHGRAIDLWQLLICRCRKVRSREECASSVETDVARHQWLPAWWCARILQVTDVHVKEQHACLSPQ